MRVFVVSDLWEFCFDVGCTCNRKGGLPYELTKLIKYTLSYGCNIYIYSPTRYTM